MCISSSCLLRRYTRIKKVLSLSLARSLAPSLLGTCWVTEQGNKHTQWAGSSSPPTPCCCVRGPGHPTDIRYIWFSFLLGCCSVTDYRTGMIHTTATLRRGVVVGLTAPIRHPDDPLLRFKLLEQNTCTHSMQLLFHGAPNIPPPPGGAHTRTASLSLSLLSPHTDTHTHTTQDTGYTGHSSSCFLPGV